jgi:hypothetical protein
VNARFCDIDHVKPWPGGPTAGTNLVCLCRRHHRVKQRLGWRLLLAANAEATWTDPTGHVRTTLPVDAVHTVVLRAPAAAGDHHRTLDGPEDSSRPTLGTPPDVFSAVEFVHEHLCATIPMAEQAHAAALRQAVRHRGGPGGRPQPDLHKRRTSRHGSGGLVLDDARYHGSRHRIGSHPGRPRHRPSGDDPPF